MVRTQDKQNSHKNGNKNGTATWKELQRVGTTERLNNTTTTTTLENSLSVPYKMKQFYHVN